jgi:dipeptidyl aminopeptidase/acylaminoacyl peptidase
VPKRRPHLLILLLAGLVVLPGCLAMRFLPTCGGVAGTPDPKIEVVRFPTSDGLTLEGRVYPPSCDRATDPKAAAEHPRLSERYRRAMVLFCHGVGDNNCSNMAEFLSNAGFRVFQFDYRGFGYSDPGPLTSRGFADDAAAALRYLRSRPDVDPDLIVVYGHSMGGAYAMTAAVAATEEGRPVRAVVTASTFSSWRRVANYQAPIAGLLLGGADGPDPADTARRLGRTPLLVLHALDDSDVPVENAYRLYDSAAAAHVPASLYIHPAGGHVWAYLAGGLEPSMLMDTATAFMKRAFNGPSPLTIAPPTGEQFTPTPGP